MYKSILSLGLLLSLSVGCNSNPYPGQGVYFEEKPIQYQVAPPYILDVPDIVEFQEGVETDFKVSGSVPSGKPIIDISGLPKGARYIPEENRVVWMPSYSDGNDPFVSGVTTKQYKVTIVLRSSDDMKTTAQRVVILNVHDIPRGMTAVDFQGKSIFFEGETFIQKLVIQDEDVPNGPFEFNASGLPHGAKISRTNDPRVFEVSFKPSYKLVNVDDYWSTDPHGETSHYKEFSWNAIFIDPRGQKLIINGVWAVFDQRQEPKFEVPPMVSTQTSSVNFIMSAEDMNGEILPVIKVDPPSTGVITLETVSTTPVSSSDNPRIVVIAKWTGNPESVNQTSEILKVKACVNQDNGFGEFCKETTVTVNFDGGSHP